MIGELITLTCLSIFTVLCSAFIIIGGILAARDNKQIYSFKDMLFALIVFAIALIMIYKTGVAVKDVIDGPTEIVLYDCSVDYYPGPRGSIGNYELYGYDVHQNFYTLEIEGKLARSISGGETLKVEYYIINKKVVTAVEIEN